LKGEMEPKLHNYAGDRPADETELFDLLVEEAEQIEKDIYGGASENEIVRRLKRLTITRFEWTSEVDSYIRRRIGYIAESLENAGVVTPTIAIPIAFDRTTNVNRVTGTNNAIINQASPPAQPGKPKRVRKATKTKVQAVKLHFYLIKDDQLSFDDRIIFSLLCKYAKISRCTKAVKLKILKRFTGFRQNTIIRSLLTLVSLGYVDANQTPLVTKAAVAGGLPTLDNGRKLVGFRKLEWLNNGRIRWQVFHGVWMTNKKAKQSQPAWFVKSLGISRATAFRYLKNFQVAGTDETAAGTDETRNRHR
jgi:hypothetical protein